MNTKEHINHLDRVSNKIKLIEADLEKAKLEFKEYQSENFGIADGEVMNVNKLVLVILKIKEIENGT